MRFFKYTCVTVLAVLLLSCCDTNSMLKSHKPDQPKSGNEKTKMNIQGQLGIRYDYLFGPAEYVVSGRKWDHYNLTYYFQNGTSDISSNQEQQAIKDAMALWTEVTDLTFTEVNNPSNADIRFLFAEYAHGDGHPFDGINGTLAHTFYPPPPKRAYAGDTHFDNSENWTISVRNNHLQPIDLVTVAAHEIGHALGLGHSSDPEALMYPYYYYGSHRYLSQDDINGIQSLYGASTPPEPPLSVSITGPHFLASGQTGTWTAHISSNEGSISYKWYRNSLRSDQWEFTGDTDNKYNMYFYNGSSSGQDAGIRVVASSAGEDAVATTWVYVSPAGCNSVSADSHSVKSNRPPPCNN